MCDSTSTLEGEVKINFEGNVFHINNEKVTVEYQPSSDQAWQFWAILTPIHIPTAESRERDLKKLNEYRKQVLMTKFYHMIIIIKRNYFSWLRIVYSRSENRVLVFMVGLNRCT